MNKVAILARVSTSAQEDNSSLDAQIGRLHAYCDSRGYEIIVERKEVFSGGFVLARSVFNELLDMMSSGVFDTIVVDIPDRLGRGDIIAKCELLAQLNGGRIEYASPGHDVSTLEGFIMKQADGFVSGIERMNIRRRTVGGKIDFAKAGRVIAPPRRPYGYDIAKEFDGRGRKINCTLAVREDEAGVVRQMFEWVAYEGLTIFEVTKRLDDLHIPRMSDHDPDYAYMQITTEKRKRHNGWSRATVGRMLANPLYRGIWRYGRIKSERIDSVGGVIIRRHQRNDDAIVEVTVPAIISDDLWYAAQDQMSQNRIKFRKPTQNRFLLRGRIRCAHCGRMLIGNSAGVGVNLRYLCGGTRPEYSDKSTRCKAKPIHACEVEGLVWQAVCNAMLDVDRLLLYIKKQREESKDAIRTLQAMIATIQAQIIKDQQKLSRLLDLYASGDITREQLREKQAEINKSKQTHDAELASMQSHLEEVTLLPEQEEALRAFQKKIASRLHGNVDYEQKLSLIDLLRVKVVYDADKRILTITGLIGECSLYTSP